MPILLARWNTDPADYPDHAIAPLKLAGGDKNEAMTQWSQWVLSRGDRSPIAR
jgi:hypothetical protein